MAALRPLSVVLVFATPRFTRYVKKKNKSATGLRFYVERPCTLVYGDVAGLKFEFSVECGPTPKCWC